MLKEFTSLRMIKGFSDFPGIDMQQKQLQSCLSDLYGVPIIKGELMDLTFPLSATDLKFQHTLGRVPKGYLTVMLDSPTIVYSSLTPIQDPERELILRVSSAPVKVRIWLF